LTTRSASRASFVGRGRTSSGRSPWPRRSPERSPAPAAEPGFDHQHAARTPTEREHRRQHRDQPGLQARHRGRPASAIAEVLRYCAERQAMRRLPHRRSRHGFRHAPGLFPALALGFHGGPAPGATCTRSRRGRPAVSLTTGWLERVHRPAWAVDRGRGVGRPPSSRSGWSTLWAALALLALAAGPIASSVAPLDLACRPPPPRNRAGSPAADLRVTGGPQAR